MSHAAFTPGPWFSTRESDSRAGHVSTSPFGHGDIARIVSRRAQADARLIAAAPDMFRVLLAIDQALKSGSALLPQRIRAEVPDVLALVSWRGQL